MNEDLQRLENWVAPLLQQLQPAQRSRLARTVGTVLRRAQQQRIGAQKNPDGSPYAARRNPPSRRAKAGAHQARSDVCQDPTGAPSARACKPQ